MSELVELHQAWMWDCPKCGRENFERAVAWEASPEDMQDAREALDMPDGTTGDFTTQPEEVECKHCKAEFPVEEPRDL